MWVHLTLKSGNVKVGPIPVSTTEKSSCPKECPLRGTDCYAGFGPLSLHWRKVKEGGRGDNWTAFCNRMRKFAAGTLFRHNQAGDLPQNAKGLIHLRKFYQLVRAVKHLRGWTYTHYNPEKKHNRDAIKFANQNGFTVNLSADSPAQADQYSQYGLPITTILPEDAPDRGNKTPEGRPIVVCPAQTADVNCAQCKLCVVANRKTIVGFRAHGIASKRLSSKIGG